MLPEIGIDAMNLVIFTHIGKLCGILIIHVNTLYVGHFSKMGKWV